MTAGTAARALLGGLGYLWLAAWEVASDTTLVLGPETAAPAGWSESVGSALGDVFVPLLHPGVLLVACVWAGAAALLPLLVRGRSPVLDMTGALIWAAGLISANRLVAGAGGDAGAEPAGLLVAALAAACLAAFAAPRLRHASEVRGAPADEASRGATA